MNNIVATSRAAILSWFTGKSKENAIAALDILEKSEAAGQWMPGARSVKAALTKANVAQKIGKKYDHELENINSRGEAKARGWEVMFALRYGQTERGAKIDFSAVRAAATGVGLKLAVRDCERYVNDFAPINALINQLDATRPEPVITHLNASPTVTKTLQDLGLVANIKTIRLPEIKWETVERTDDKGHKTFVKVGTIIWPEGTVHGASRYSNTDHNDQCQACGHAIKNPWNWVPLIIDNEIGVPHSLWVGVDCSRTIFGVQVKGPMELIENPAGVR